MKKCMNFMVIGSGWRSLFYGRIADFYPERFHMTGLLCRTEEKAEHIRSEYGYPATTSVEACESGKPDFVVVAVNKNSVFQVAKEWILKGYPVLCETPAGTSLEELRQLWQLHTEHGAKIQVAEQYFCYPTYAASVEVAKKGYLGDPHMVDLSALHDYHAASMIRRYLGIGFQNMKVSGKNYTYSVMDTDSRYGAVTDGHMTDRGRAKITFEFEGGKTAFYDFDGVQYHSFIRSRHLNVRGDKGEQYDWTVRYADDSFHALERQIVVHRTTDDSGIWKVTLGTGDEAAVPYGNQSAEEVVLYRNPFAAGQESTCMPQDETAIATLMEGMGRYIEEGTEAYPLAEGLQDAYVMILMEEALRNPGQVVESETQLWA